jgi:CHAD domain-containing protein
MKGSPVAKWLAATIRAELRVLERARRRFVRKPNEERLHELRTTGRRFRSLLETAATVIPADRLRRQVKRAATATDAARDASILARLLEHSVDPLEADLARPLLDEVRAEQELATRRACKVMRRMRFGH